MTIIGGGNRSSLYRKSQNFDGTILENLEAVSDKAEPEEVANAIRTAGLKDFLDKTLDGTNSKLDFPNSRFSLGTRKRIALARAIISDGNFVVMDEPTEGLDADGAQVFYKYLNLCIDRKNCCRFVTRSSNHKRSRYDDQFRQQAFSKSD